MVAGTAASPTRIAYFCYGSAGGKPNLAGDEVGDEVKSTNLTIVTAL